jgi:hypothetical protein
VGRGKDDTLFALVAGAVKFGKKRGRKTVNIIEPGTVIESGKVIESAAVTESA